MFSANNLNTLTLRKIVFFWVNLCETNLFLGEVYFATVSRTGHRERGTSLKVQLEKQKTKIMKFLELKVN